MKRTFLALALVVASSGLAAQTRESVSKGINQLGLKTLSQIQKDQKGENVFISALSLHEAITMAYAGATGETRKELAALLGLDSQASDSDLADLYQSLREELISADPKVKFDIANSMWGNSDQRVRFVKEFVALNRQAHDAEIREMDFQAPDFLSTLNGWVAKKTQGKIPHILSGPIPEDQLFYLVNAVYFKGAWTTEFDKKLTREETFTNSSREQSQVKMMRRFASFDYYTDRAVEAVKIPFGKDKRFSMAIYAPRGVQADVLSVVTPAALKRAEQGFIKQEGTIVVPRFKIEYTNEKMVELYQKLGVQKSFSNAAQFPNIAENEAVKINTIIHKAVIEVNEEGAEAAAATVVGGMRATSISVHLPFFFQVDRPFYFEISENQTGTTVFSGVLNQVK